MISTDRLTIRPFTKDDGRDLYEYLSNPAIYRYEPGEPISLEQAVVLAGERANTNRFFAVVLMNTGKMIGHLYFNQIEPPSLRTWELGYIMNPAYQQKGYTTEAAVGLLKWAFPTHNIHRVVAFCNPENTASWKVLEKIGMRREGILKKNIFFMKRPDGAELWTDTYEYAMLEEEAKEKLG